MAGEYVDYLERRCDQLEQVLQRIESWKMPETGKFWPNPDGTDSDRPVTYGAAYGSNGERDYIRHLAAEALWHKRP